MTEDTADFVPGSYWTPERADAAVARMLAVMASPPFSAMFEDGMNDGGQTPAAMLDLAPAASNGPQPPLDATNVIYRRARATDVPRMAQLMAAEQLPPLFITQFLGGFVVADCEGEVVAAGGVEMYGDIGAIRSVVVDPRLRGTGVGRRLAELMEADARASGAREAYLFTQHAHPFWLHLGFEDFGLDDWVDVARQSWQWQFINRHGASVGEIWSMRKALRP